ncbi:MAG: radical SAM protein [Candidatus Aureabacteria bacterium]|nr:radical SAM protein [Candidatus Auribacterota bacterium]
MKDTYSYLFGPVLSRRLGVSLGVDLVPLKTCSFNCRYCECGDTSEISAERKEYVPTETVIDELKRFLKNGPNLDFVTFSGSGEPTLHSRIGDVILFLKKRYPDYRLALLTNGSLFNDRRLRRNLMNIDVVLPSLDAGTQRIFQIINRPSSGIRLGSIIRGLTDFRKDFKGEIWLEVFIVPGRNDTQEELSGIRSALKRIKPDKVQLNTLDRPGADPSLIPAKKRSLESILRFLDYPGEIIARFPTLPKSADVCRSDACLAVLRTLARRPSTQVDLCSSLGIDKQTAELCLKRLLYERIIAQRRLKRGVFFSCVKHQKEMFC